MDEVIGVWRWNVGINWYEWGKEAFEKAKKFDMPILLDLTASWCHWCSVMDSTSYADSEIIEILNSKFIPVRVDIDKHPDIKERYNFGGFPTTAFLTPEGELLTGATYVAPGDLKVMLKNVEYDYREKREEILRRMEDFRKLKPDERKKTGKASWAIVERIVDDLLKVHDSAYGGFGTQPKFLFTEGISLLLLQYDRTADENYLNTAVDTLDKMRVARIYDSVESGFFRFSVTQDWSLPHYEKMLEGNSNLLRNYLSAYHATQREEFRETAAGILSYIETNLKNPQGGFYGSQTADEEYYALPLEGRKKREKPKIDRAIYADLNGFAISSYLESSLVFGDKYRMFAQKSADYIWEKCREKSAGMYHYYDEKPQEAGHLSDNVLFGLSLIDCYQFSADNKYLKRAEELAAFVLGNFQDKGGGFFDIMLIGEPVGRLRERIKPIELNSYALMFCAELYNLTGKEKYREAAEATANLFAGDYSKHNYLASVYALTVAYLLEKNTATIVGNLEKSRLLQRELLAVYKPGKLVQVLDPDRDGGLLESLGYPAGEELLVYVCSGKKCFAPTGDMRVAVSSLGGK